MEWTDQQLSSYLVDLSVEVEISCEGAYYFAIYIVVVVTRENGRPSSGQERQVLHNGEVD